MRKEYPFSTPSHRGMTQVLPGGEPCFRVQGAGQDLAGGEGSGWRREAMEWVVRYSEEDRSLWTKAEFARYSQEDEKSPEGLKQRSDMT